MSITRGSILRGGITAGGILRSQQGNPYAFSLDLTTGKDAVTGKALSCAITGTRYDEVGGVTTAFGTNVPTICDKGLRTVGTYSNYFLNSATPATQSITLAAGTYTLGIIGTGSVTYNSNTATAGSPVTFILASSTTANATVTGTVSRAMLSKTKRLYPYVPTTTYAYSSPSESGGSSLGVWVDDIQTKHPLLYSALQSAGTMTLKWRPGYSSADVTGKLNILSFDGVTKTLDYDADSQFIRFTDDTITLVSALTVVADTEYSIKVSWGNGTMQLSVDDSVPCQGVFSGFTLGNDIVFGLSNNELQYISELKVLKAEDKALTTNTREFFFDVISTQTVAGVFRTTAGQTVTIYWGDGSSTPVTGTTDQAYSKDYGSVGSRTVTIVNKSALTKFTMVTAAANIKFNLKSLSVNLTYLYILGSNTISGTIASLPASLTHLICYGSNTISGDLSSLSTNFTYLICTGNNIISGSLSSLSTNLTYFYCTGNNTVSGNLSSLSADLIFFVCAGYNTISDYSGKTWANNQDRIYLAPVSPGGLSSAEVDQLLIDLANVTTWTGTKQVSLQGTNAARTSASTAAVATLVSKGVTVTTN